MKRGLAALAVGALIFGIAWLATLPTKPIRGSTFTVTAPLDPNIGVPCHGPTPWPQICQPVGIPSDCVEAKRAPEGWICTKYEAPLTPER